MAVLAKERFGTFPSDLEAVAIPLYWGHCGSSGGNIKPMEIRNGTAVVELGYCSFAIDGTPPEMCVAGSHYLAEGISEAVNPAYEFVFTHYLTNDDGFCRYVVKRKSSKINLNDPGILERRVSIKLSQEEAEFLALNLAFMELNYMTAGSVKVIGSDRVNELVAPFSRQTGIDLGKKLNDGNENNKNLPNAKDKLDLLNSMFNQVGPPANISESGIDKEVLNCPFKYGSPEICKQIEGLFIGVCHSINPDYEFAYDRMMTKGDQSCHWTVKNKTNAIQTKDGISSNDPARMLAMRFAKGGMSLENLNAAWSH